ncbi:uncharacterized protein DUF2852 [Roseiarcus fermentans]|uniref:Uncharacterized protein DUF2852 n=1 Tax=Roseiarcus fermentans TaxID=1473586 RepID=A0A366FGK6_9HYPH|nr:DUF2852 domain-containing protein [Roseiarcus fermentans]RBP13812.1 uncharacterized protein DUF2852 [Roseiarcus fermentans]
MSDTFEGPRPRWPGPLPHDFDPWRWGERRHGPPLPVKILAVAVAFWLFHPLGVALLVYFLWRAARGRGCGFHADRFGTRAHVRRSSGNTAFEERRRETLKALDEEAEAFEAFEKRRREAQDREAFERFVAERNAPKGDEPPK